MESATKQRLVGAIVLVGAIAWIVPVFLDGPANDPQTISETVELPGIQVSETERHQIELPRTGAPQSEPKEPVAMPAPGQQPDVQPELEDTTPAETGAVEAVVEQTPAATPAPSESAQPTLTTTEPDEPARDEPAAVDTSPEPAASEPPADRPTPSSDTGMFAVQLGSFSSRENAGALAKDLRATGVAAFLTEVKTASGSMHRVRIGPVESRSAAEKLQGELAAQGHEGQVVPHP